MCLLHRVNLTEELFSSWTEPGHSLVPHCPTASRDEGEGHLRGTGPGSCTGGPKNYLAGGRDKGGSRLAPSRISWLSGSAPGSVTGTSYRERTGIRRNAGPYAAARTCLERWCACAALSPPHSSPHPFPDIFPPFSVFPVPAPLPPRPWES